MLNCILFVPHWIEELLRLWLSKISNNEIVIIVFSKLPEIVIIESKFWRFIRLNLQFCSDSISTEIWEDEGTDFLQFLAISRYLSPDRHKRQNTYDAGKILSLFHNFSLSLSLSLPLSLSLTLSLSHTHTLSLSVTHTYSFLLLFSFDTLFTNLFNLFLSSLLGFGLFLFTSHWRRNTINRLAVIVWSYYRKEHVFSLFLFILLLVYRAYVYFFGE